MANLVWLVYCIILYYVIWLCPFQWAAVVGSHQALWASRPVTVEHRPASRTLQPSKLRNGRNVLVSVWISVRNIAKSFVFRSSASVAKITTTQKLADSRFCVCGVMVCWCWMTESCDGYEMVTSSCVNHQLKIEASLWKYSSSWMEVVSASRCVSWSINSRLAFYEVVKSNFIAMNACNYIWPSMGTFTDKLPVYLASWLVLT